VLQEGKGYIDLEDFTKAVQGPLTYVQSDNTISGDLDTPNRSSGPRDFEFNITTSADTPNLTNYTQSEGTQDVVRI